MSDERKWVNTWTLFYVAATIGVLLLCVVSSDNSDRVRITAAAIISIISVSVILSLRFDALLTTEFRDRTWGSLMLLPVDPCDLLKTKLWAAMWEQRFAALPVGVALVSLLLVGPKEAIVVVGMVAVIATLAGGLLCQMSCITQLLGKLWWIGLCQTVGFIAVIVASFAIWIPCGQWLGFVLATAFLTSVVVGMQYGCIDRLARNWVET